MSSEVEEPLININSKRCLDPARHDNKRSSSDQCVTQFCEHDFYRDGLVLDPTQYLAATRAVHDRRDYLIDPVSDWLHCLSCARRREIIRLHRLDSRDLFSDAGFARSAGVRDLAACDPDAHPGVWTPLGPASAHWPLDDADLALCVGDRCARLPHALPVVPATESCTQPVVDV